MTLVLPTDVRMSFGSYDELGEMIDRPAKLLAADELSRGSTFAFSQDAERYVLSRAFLRMTLARELFPTVDGNALRAEARRLPLMRTVFGKPYLKSGGNVPAFSLSRSSGGVAIALGWNVALGIDVESSCARRHLQPEFLRFAFSPAEQRHLSESAAPEETALKLWTRKEAIVKADGRGLRFPPHRIETMLTVACPSALPSALGEPHRFELQTTTAGAETLSVAIVRGFQLFLNQS